MFRLPVPIYILALATSCLMTGTPLAVLIGGLIGAKLAPTPALATLPLAIMVVGLALNAYPASMLLGRFGHRRLFAVATALCLLANSVAITALTLQSFSLWLLAMLLIGAVAACAQQMRFAVTAYLGSNKEQVPVALSVFMLGGILAAIIGPELGVIPRLFNLTDYASGFVIAALLQLGALMVVMLTPKAPIIDASLAANSPPQTRSLALLAIAASITGYGLMSFIMTATPISMHEHHGHSLDDTKRVIQWHILAMFIPSFMTGHLIKRLGIPFAMWAGLACFGLTSLVTLNGFAMHNYALGLILLGVGWNFLFTAGSTLAAQNPNPSFKGHHDATVFAVQAVASLSAGLVLNYLGWLGMQWLALAGLAPLALMLLVNWQANQRLQPIDALKP